MKYLGFVFLMGLCACSQSDSEVDYFQIDFENEVRKISAADSIPLFDSLHYFNYAVNLERLQENKIMAAQVPGLRVFLLDSLGKVRKKITQKGNAPGMLGNSNFALSTIGESGQIYVLTAGNIYRLFVFNPDGVYLESYSLYQLLPELYVPPVNSSLSVIEKSEGQLLLSFSVGSTLYESRTPEFFRESSGIAQFLIDRKDQKVLQHSTRVPLSEIEEVVEALEKESVYWNQSSPIFDFENGKFYVAFAFSPFIRVYDEEFNLLEKILVEKLKPLYRIGFEKAMGKGSNSFYQTTLTEERLRQENLNISNIDVREGIVMLQFSEIFKKGTYPLTKEEEVYNIRAQPYSFYQHLIIKDLETEKEEFITLPEHVFEAKLVGTHSVRAAYVNPEFEEKYLVKYCW